MGSRRRKLCHGGRGVKKLEATCGERDGLNYEDPQVRAHPQGEEKKQLFVQLTQSVLYPPRRQGQFTVFFMNRSIVLGIGQTTVIQLPFRLYGSFGPLLDCCELNGVRCIFKFRGRGDVVVCITNFSDDIVHITPRRRLFVTVSRLGEIWNMDGDLVTQSTRGTGQGAYAAEHHGKLSSQEQKRVLVMGQSDGDKPGGMTEAQWLLQPGKSEAVQEKVTVLQAGRARPEINREYTEIEKNNLLEAIKKG